MNIGAIDDVRDLLRDVGPDPVLTLYLPTDPADPANHRDAGTRAWEVQLRSDLHRLSATAPGDERFEAARAEAERWLAAHQPTARTLVLFVAPERVIDIDLPVAVSQTAQYGRPAVAALARAVSEHRRYCFVLVDGAAARVAEAAMGFVDDRAMLRLDTRWGEPWPTRSGARFRFIARRQEYQARHQRDIAGRIDRLLEDRPNIDRLVLGGNEAEAHGVARSLGQAAGERLVGLVPAPLASSEAELMQRLGPVAERVEQEADRAVVEALKAATGSGRAVFGRRAVLDALATGAVQEVVLSSHLTERADPDAVVGGALMAGAFGGVVNQDAADELDGTDGIAALLHYAAVVPG